MGPNYVRETGVANEPIWTQVKEVRVKNDFRSTFRASGAILEVKTNKEAVIPRDQSNVPMSFKQRGSI